MQRDTWPFISQATHTVDTENDIMACVWLYPISSRKFGSHVFKLFMKARELNKTYCIYVETSKNMGVQVANDFRQFIEAEWLIKLGHRRLRWLLFTCFAPSQFENQRWIIVNIYIYSYT